MRILITVLGLSFGSLAFGGGDVIPLAPKQSKVDECPPLPATTTPTPAPKPKEDECKPKPKPNKPKPTPKPKPCPEVKCKTCEPKVVVRDRVVEVVKEKVVEIPVEKIKYIDRTVTVDTADKHTLNAFVGLGPHGIVTDSYQTEERRDEYAVRKEKDRAIGGVIGAQYQYRFSRSWNASGIVISNETVMLGGGFSW
jgi:hypothetical protein